MNATFFYTIMNEQNLQKVWQYLCAVFSVKGCCSDTSELIAIQTGINPDEVEECLKFLLSHQMIYFIVSAKQNGQIYRSIKKSGYIK